MSLDGFGGGLWEDKSGVGDRRAAAARPARAAHVHGRRVSTHGMDIASGRQPGATSSAVGGGGAYHASVRRSGGRKR